ncbi:MAG TPA: hypothetical protein VFL04_02035 [Rectinemataceae bacterium]|nr:hypothetical protein [Rectinemataceae bacterium]
MPIRPIDLQTLLMQLSQVGRDQAAEKDAALRASMQTAADQVKQVEQKEAVRHAQEPDTGPQAIKDRQGGGPGGSSLKKKEEGEPEAAEGEDEVIRDPSLGNSIDISG